MIDLGDLVPLTWTTPDPVTLVATDPTATTVTVTAPDLTTSVGTLTLPSTPSGAIVVSKTATGTFRGLYTTAQSGLHTIRYTWTGAGAGASADSFTVESIAAAAAGIVGLADLKLHLGGGIGAGNDDRLRQCILVASDLVERYTGRVWRRQTVTETYVSDGQAQLVLRTSPTVAVTAVSENGAALAGTDYVLDPHGVLWRGSLLAPVGWSPGSIVVTYSAGPTLAPAMVRQAVLELARHVWSTQIGGTALPRQQGSGIDEWDPRQGYAIPRRVAELLDRYVGVGFA